MTFARREVRNIGNTGLGATEVGSVYLGLNINTGNINRQIRGAANNATSIAKSAFSGVAKTITAALGTAAVVGFTKDCIKLGSNLAEVQNVVDTAFKTMNADVNKFAKNAMTNFGLSELSAKKYMGVFGQMSSAMGFAEKSSLEMAKNVTALTGDVASFYNLSSDEAYNKLKSIWTGETETLKELGVILTQTNLDQYALNNGFGKTTAKMTEQEKVMLRYQYVMDSLSNASGDFIKTQDSWANQTRILSLRFEQLKATLGQSFIALFTPIVKGINNCMTGLQSLADKFNAFIAQITGNQPVSNGMSVVSESAIEAANSITGVGEAVESAAKLANRSLAGFDKVTKIGEAAADSTSGITNTGTANSNGLLNTSGNSNQTKDKGVLADFKKEFFNTFTGIEELATSFGKYLKGPFNNLISTAFNNAKKQGANLYKTYKNVFDKLWSNAVRPVLQNFVDVGLPLCTEFVTECIESIDTLQSEITTTFNKIFNEAGADTIKSFSDKWIEFVNILDEAWQKWGEPVFDAIDSSIKNTGELFRQIWDDTLEPIWSDIMSTFDSVWREHLQPLLENFVDFVGEWITGAAVIYNEFILPLVEFLSSVLGPSVQDTFSFIGDIVAFVFGGICDLLNYGVLDALKGFIKFIKGVFAGDWSAAWSGIKDIFASVFDGLVIIAKSPINLIIELLNGMIGGCITGINTLIRTLNKISFKVPDWIPGLGGKSFGFNIQEVESIKIPKLAQGGYVKANTPQLAMIGDNLHQGEVVAPEDKLKEMALEAAQMSNGGALMLEAIKILKEILKVLKELDLDISIDGMSLKKYIVDKINENTRVTGECEIIS